MRITSDSSDTDRHHTRSRREQRSIHAEARAEIRQHLRQCACLPPARVAEIRGGVGVEPVGVELAKDRHASADVCARELVVRNNVFARSAQEGLIGVGRVEDCVAATLLHNVLLGPAPLLYEGGYKGDVRDAFRTDANLIWFQGAPVATSGHGEFRTDVPHRISFEDWRATGHDCVSVVADPHISEAETSLEFAPTSPALQLGFRPVDWRRCGPRKG